MGMIDDLPKPRWYRLTPDRLVIGLLVVECLLWLSGRFQWFPFNEKKGWTVLIAAAVVGVVFIAMLLWFIASLLFHWRFQSSIRSLLLLAVVVTIVCTWMTVEMKAAKRNADAFVAIEESGQVSFASLPELGPVWLRRLLGNGFLLPDVTSVDFPGVEVTDAALENVKGLDQLNSLSLMDSINITDVGLNNLKRLNKLESLILIEGTQITDGGLENLKGLDRLQLLCLQGTKVTDVGLEHLKGLNRLHHLDLGGSRVTDAGLEYLKGMNELQELCLEGTNVTDAGLTTLKGLDRLELLQLQSTKVTDEGVKRLKQALPNCRIYH